MRTIPICDVNGYGTAAVNPKAISQWFKTSYYHPAAVPTGIYLLGSEKAVYSRLSFDEIQKIMELTDP